MPLRAPHGPLTALRRDDRYAFSHGKQAPPQGAATRRPATQGRSRKAAPTWKGAFQSSSLTLGKHLHIPHTWCNLDLRDEMTLGDK